MSKLMLLAATSTMLAAPALATQTNNWFEPSMFDRAADVFESADRNDDEQLSQGEYLDLRLNVVDARWVRAYGSDWRIGREPLLEKSYAAVDGNDDGSISLTEYSNAATKNLADAKYVTEWKTDVSAGWDPEYMTVTYYLTANRIDADAVEGREIYNLEGDEIGTIDRIVRAEDSGEYYAMIDIDGAADITWDGVQRDEAGVPLDDVLLYSSDHALLLSERGEEYLREADARLLEDAEQVETLYAV